MSILAKINQRESLEKLDKEGKRVVRKAQILAVLGTIQEPLTAREIANYLGYTGFYSANAVKPRLTELAQEGSIKEAKKSKYDNATNRKVTAYVLVGTKI